MPQREQRGQQRPGSRGHFSVAHHQRAAMDENDDRAHGIAERLMHIGLQAVPLIGEGFERVSLERWPINSGR